MSTFLTPNVFFFPEQDTSQLKAQQRRVKFVGHEVITCRDDYTNAISEHVSIIDPKASPMTAQEERDNTAEFNPGQVKLKNNKNIASIFIY